MSRTPDPVASIVPAAGPEAPLCRRLHLETLATLPENERRWLLGRAAAVLPNGAPVYSADELARNLRRSRRVALSARSIRRLIEAANPELARRRAEGFRTALRRRSAPGQGDGWTAGPIPGRRD